MPFGLASRQGRSDAAEDHGQVNVPLTIPPDPALTSASTNDAAGVRAWARASWWRTTGSARPGRRRLASASRRSARRWRRTWAGRPLRPSSPRPRAAKRADRPELARAISACRLYGARLVIAKLDRLSRDAHFLLGLEKAGVDFVAADMPHANRLTVGIMALVAEEERRMISARTKAALAAAKARGTALGGFRGYTITAAAGEAGRRAQAARAGARLADLAPVLSELRADGISSLGGVAAALNIRGIPAAQGGTWTSTQVRRAQGSIQSSVK